MNFYYTTKDQKDINIYDMNFVIFVRGWVYDLIICVIH